MENPTHSTGQPMFVTDDTARLQREVTRLQDLVMTGQRLVTKALDQKAAAQANEQRLLERNTAMWQMLRRVKRHWTYRFLPQELRAMIEEEIGRAD